MDAKREALERQLVAQGLMTPKRDVKAAIKEALVGHKVLELQTVKSDGIEYTVLMMEGGFAVAVMSDEEGNGGGSLMIDACPDWFSKKYGLA
jgi:hypothetical protein